MDPGWCNRSTCKLVQASQDCRPAEAQDRPQTCRAISRDFLLRYCGLDLEQPRVAAKISDDVLLKLVNANERVKQAHASEPPKIEHEAWADAILARHDSTSILVSITTKERDEGQARRKISALLAQGRESVVLGGVDNLLVAKISLESLAPLLRLWEVVSVA